MLSRYSIGIKDVDGLKSSSDRLLFSSAVIPIPLNYMPTCTG